MTGDAPPSAPQRILFCTDFSETADHAFRHALRIARDRPGSELILLHVIPEPEAQFWKTYISDVEDVEAKARADVDAKVDRAYRSQVPAGVTFRAVISVGNVAAEVIALAEQVGADLIIVGRQGHSPLADLVFGAVVDKVIRAARCPVLVVPKTAS